MIGLSVQKNTILVRSIFVFLDMSICHLLDNHLEGYFQNLRFSVH